MSKGQQLENNLANIMRDIFTPSYWPNRSGIQNGYDAYANFKIKKKEYLWKFECKDLNRQKHNHNYSDVSEIEFADFSDKILELMSMGNSYYPDVYCLFIPHKRYKSNTVFLERLTSLNTFNKFPFKIIIWDFDFLKDKIPNINISDADTIFPNAPDKDKSNHDKIILGIKEELEKESVDGYLHRRSYIREREAKYNVVIDEALFIKIEEVFFDDPTIPPQFKFSINNQQFIFDGNDIGVLSINTYPYVNASIKNNGLETGAVPVIETVKEASVEEDKIFDIKQHLSVVEEKKANLITLFKKVDASSGQCLFTFIKNFCFMHPQGIVSFICPARHLVLASLPIREFTAADFESSNAIHFYFEFK